MSKKISVCMAAYNGEKHIKIQIDSILHQLRVGDELIVVDDCSSDETVEIIKNFDDLRIKLMVNQVNAGVASALNMALQKAEGDIIFLADQDDVWYDFKVSTVIDFMEKSNACLVIHDAVVVKDNMVISDSLHNMIGRSSGIINNVISNTFTGCCMAFRRDVLRYVLPMPAKIGIYHDAWIGILAQIFRFKIILLRIPLMNFVRHGGNASTFRKRALGVIISERFLFIRTLMLHVILLLLWHLKIKFKNKMSYFFN